MGAGLGRAASVRGGLPEEPLGCRAGLTITLGPILLIVDALTPTRFKSATDANGLPPMIFLAVAGPTPGRASSCSWEAVFKSIGPTLTGAAFSLRALLSVRVLLEFEEVGPLFVCCADEVAIDKMEVTAMTRARRICRSLPFKVRMRLYDFAAISMRLAVGAFFITESIPLSREDSDWYISLFPIT